MVSNKKDQNRFNFESNLPLTSIRVKNKLKNDLKHISLRLSEIDKNILDLESERVDLYLKKSKLKQKESRRS